MAQYNGYRTVPHATFDEWLNATLGNGYDVDGYYGDQCWDYCSLLYYQYGMTLITKPGGGTAADCWNVSRSINSRPPFTSIEGVENIRRGDIVVWNSNIYSSTGHIAFATQDYSNKVWNTDDNSWHLDFAGQNQGPGHGPNGTPVNIYSISLNNFLGIFRNTEWGTTPPTPPIPVRRGKFPWVLYAKKFRNGRI